ncbi:hypothetical protein X474_21470 [Dethiosulfatarculus sandiegensis]|uniref:Uncharacterized protein n=1 Tax=Dethiosulfatarculus sandiegensis TaxID=1429043 RepID=A0A0D2J8H3_9BACT|nr:hypothetical protein X474_21470 [Dethiosulfatarculus sandiegensis]
MIQRACLVHRRSRELKYLLSRLRGPEMPAQTKRARAFFNPLFNSRAYNA